MHLCVKSEITQATASVISIAKKCNSNFVETQKLAKSSNSNSEKSSNSNSEKSSNSNSVAYTINQHFALVYTNKIQALFYVFLFPAN